MSPEPQIPNNENGRVQPTNLMIKEAAARRLNTVRGSPNIDRKKFRSTHKSKDQRNRRYADGSHMTAIRSSNSYVSPFSAIITTIGNENEKDNDNRRQSMKISTTNESDVIYI